MICKNCKSRMKKDNSMKTHLNYSKKKNGSYNVSKVYRCKNCDWSLIVFETKMWLDENNEEVK